MRAVRLSPSAVTLAKRHRTWVALGALVVVGAALRFVTLDARGFWLDEAITLQIIDGGAAEIVRTTLTDETTPPFYYLLAWAWTGLFGTGEVGLRSLSALIGSATIPVAYCAGRQLVSARTGLAAAALAAVGPMVVWHSQDGRPYALLILLAGLSFVLFLRALDAGSGRRLAAWAVVSTLAVATHYFAAFPVAAEAAWLLLVGPRRRATKLAAGATAVAVAGLLTAALRVRATSGSGSGEGVAAWIGTLDLPTRLARVPAEYVVGPQPPLQVLAVAVAGLLMLVAIYLLATRTAEAERRAAALAGGVAAAAILVPIAGTLVGADYLNTRNVAAGWIPLACAAALALTARHAGRLGVAALVGLCSLSIAIVIASADEPKFERDDWRGAADSVGEASRERAIVLSPALGAAPFGLYREDAEPMRDGSTFVAEVVLLGLAPPFREVGEAPRPPNPDSVTPPDRRFELVERRAASHYTLYRFRAERPVLVARGELERSALSDFAEVLVEPRS